MDDTSRDPAITEDEIRALQFSAGDVAEIEQTILSFVDACHTRKVAMVVGSTINTSKIAMVNGGETCRIFIALILSDVWFSRGISGIRRFVSYAL